MIDQTVRTLPSWKSRKAYLFPLTKKLRKLKFSGAGISRSVSVVDPATIHGDMTQAHCVGVFPLQAHGVGTLLRIMAGVKSPEEISVNIAFALCTL